MNADEVRDAIALAVRETMETMFFNEVSGADGTAPIPGEALCAEIRFDGCTQGFFRLAVERQAAAELASCLVGPDEGDCNPESAVGEVANIVCGATLSHLYAEGHISLSSPRMTEGLPEDGEAVRSMFRVDSGQLAAEMVWRP